jgi:hypothetical protein
MTSYTAFVFGIRGYRGAARGPSGVSPRCSSSEGKLCTCITSDLTFILIGVIYEAIHPTSYAHAHNITNLEGELLNVLEVDSAALGWKRESILRLVLPMEISSVMLYFRPVFSGVKL